MGRPRKPTAVLKAQGTWQSCRHTDLSDEPQHETIKIMPDPPDHLGEVGRSKWFEIAPQLQSSGCLTTVDLPAFSLYCEAWDEFAWGLEEIRKEGRTAVSEKGGVYQHPAVGIKNRAIDRIKQFGSEFGMTPSSRNGLRIEKNEPASKGKRRFFAS